MQLLFPAAVLGLLTVPLILLLHIMRSRREQRPISSLALWRGLQQQKRGSRFQSLPLTLLLIMQLCIAATLVAALARPVSSFVLADPWHTIFIIDTTTSMATTAATESYFDQARQQVRMGIETAGLDDTMSIISLEKHPRILFTSTQAETESENDDETNRVTINRVKALSELDNLRLGGTGIDLPTALNLATSLIDPNRNNRIVVLTDGHYSVDPTRLPPVPIQIDWQILGNSESNQALLNVSAKRQPDGSHRLFARLVNYGDISVQRTVEVAIDGDVVEPRTVEIPAGGETVEVWTVTERQAQSAQIKLLEDDSLAIDNMADVWLQSGTRHRVLLQAETPDPLTRALLAQPNVDLTIDTPDDDASYNPADFDLTILQNQPLDFSSPNLPSGDLLIVNPQPQQEQRLNLRADTAIAAPWLAEIDFSGVYFGRVYTDTLPNWLHVALKSKVPQIGPETGDAASPSRTETSSNIDKVEGQPLIVRGHDGQRQVTIWTFDLGDSNLPARLAFPLLMDSTLATMLNPLPPATLAVGESLAFDSNNFVVELPDGQRLAELSPGESLFTHTKLPGIYRIYERNGSQQAVAGFAVQAGSAFESNLSLNGLRDSLNGLPRSSATGIARDPEVVYNDFWFWLVGFALIVVVLEGWIVWRS